MKFFTTPIDNIEQAAVPTGKILVQICMMAVCSVLCTGCMAVGSGKGEGVGTAVGMQVEGSMQKWSHEYSARPDDTRVAIAYSEALEREGNTDQSLAIARKILISHPQDKNVLARYGKALAAAGQYSMAIDAMERAQTPDQPDWRLLSAEATVLDRMGEFERARTLYDRAQALAPQEPSIVSNMGVSLMLSGDLPGAERKFRQAILMRGADRRTRENLALVVALQRRPQEARELYGGTLSPEQVNENLDYISRITKV